MTITPDNILHWKRKLEKQLEEREILITLSKLKKAPMTIKILQETGVGKTVKALKKSHSGQIASKSEDLINQWKKLLDDPAPSKNSDSKKDAKRSQAKAPKSANGHTHQSEVMSMKPSHHGSNSSSRKKDEKLFKLAENTTEGLNNSAGSFEACLGLNDSFQVKKKKAAQVSSKPSVSKSITSQSVTSSKPSSSHRQSLESSSKHKHEENKKSSQPTKKIKAEPTVPAELQKPNLSPLEPVDVLSTLPEIQPHYKPLPHIEPPPSNKRKVLTNDEALYFTTTKRDRTAVYSGRKHGGVGDVPSLVQYCTKYLLDNLDDLSETGGVPFNLLKPILEKCNTTQLYTLEDYNPYLLEDTDYLWEIHCKRDFKNCTRDEFETWREVYLRLFEEREQKLKAIAANITASQASATPVRKAKIAYFDVAAKPPRDVARKQAKLGTASSSNNPPRISRPSAPSTPSSTSQPTPESTSSTASSSTSTPLQVKKAKTAPLMQKTLKLLKNMRR